MGNKTPEARIKTEAEMRKMLGSIYDTGGLCGKGWLLEHGMDVTMEDIENQKLEVVSPDHKTTINAKLKKKDIRTILESTMADGRNLAHPKPANSPSATAPSMGTKKVK